MVDRRVTPARCGWRRDLYAIPDAGVSAQILEEKLFKRIDTAAARALHMMLTPTVTTLDPAATLGWVTFIQSLFHRSPENMRVTKLAGKEVWRATLPEFRDAYTAIRAADDPLTFEEYVEKRDPIEAEQSLLWSLPRLIMNDTVGQHLQSIPWVQFHVPPDEPELLLSDDPMMRTNGIKTPNGHIAMPLSPRRLLVIASERSTIKSIDDVPIRQLVKDMNKWTVASARHFVVASDTRQAPFIKKHFGTSPKPSLNQGIVQRAQAARYRDMASPSH